MEGPMAMDWYKRYPDKYLSDERLYGLTLEQEGAYNRLLETLYRYDGLYPNNVEQLRHVFRTYHRLKCRKLWESIRHLFDIEGDHITHPTVTKRVQEYQQQQVMASEAGKRGGRPKKVTLLDDKAIKNKNKNKKEIYKEGEKPKRFIPPSVSEVDSYCQERDYKDFDPDKFIDFYEGKGWMVGRSKMKSWQAAVRNAHREGWCRRNGKAGEPHPEAKQVPCDHPGCGYAATLKIKGGNNWCPEHLPSRRSS